MFDLTLERQRELLRRGAVLVDERDPGTKPRVLFYLDHAIPDARLTRSAGRVVMPYWWTSAIPELTPACCFTSNMRFKTPVSPARASAARSRARCCTWKSMK